MVGRSQMPTNHNTPATASTSSRAAKRKAESSPTQEEPATTGSQSRPQRKKQKQQQQPSSTSPSASPVATATATTTIKGNESALTKHLLGLLDEIKNAVDDEGREITTDFETLPNKKRYPDYFVTIKKPIALDTILERINNEEYDDTEALKADLTLMTANAKKYNVKGSSIYEDAVAIQRIVKDYPSDVPQPLKVTLRQGPPKEKRVSAPPPAPPKQTAQQAQEELLEQLEKIKEPRTKRVYTEIFMEAPSKKEYPEYYAYIQRVICLNEIKRNVKKGVYKTWADYEADVELVWTNAMAFNEDGSQVYEDAKILKAAFEKALKEKKTTVGEPTDSHMKVKLNLQPHLPPPTTTQQQPLQKIKLHMPQPAPSPPAITPSSPAPLVPLKKESPILAPQPLPPITRPQQLRQGSPLKNQITASPSKSPPSLRPAPPKPANAPTNVPTIAPNKDIGIPLTDWARTPSVGATPSLQANRMIPQQGGQAQGNLRPAPPLAPQKTGVVIPPSQENGVRQPLHNLMLNNKRERSLTLIPLVTLSTNPATLPSPSPVISSTSTTSSSPQPNSLPPIPPSLLLNITSPTPPAPSTQTICLTVPKDIPELILTAYLTKDLTLHGSYTFTVSSQGRKLSPTVWPDGTRRSGTTDSIAVAPRGTTPTSPNPAATGVTGTGTPQTGDMWRFTLTLGDPGSVTSIEAGCTAFLKRDERGLLVRGERSRTGQAAGEDGGELERIVILVLRGR